MFYFSSLAHFDLSSAAPSLSQFRIKVFYFKTFSIVIHRQKAQIQVRKLGAKFPRCRLQMACSVRTVQNLKTHTIYIHFSARFSTGRPDVVWPANHQKSVLTGRHPLPVVPGEKDASLEELLHLTVPQWKLIGHWTRREARTFASFVLCIQRENWVAPLLCSVGGISTFPG